ncbi:zincin-like metallopeptidase domain-containing protein [Nitrosomonas aestuarii]|uniref:zincin-like metallopeptidase domain-containing protein n=1 Tax=Nitrosomonas aestuarii TaxID=52441 RepID=UPI000D2F7B28|nr:zincin-like metallopeptidase domain-containing protein [Nitrosomonas aestuarii]PTN09676.1 antirestriction protein ArdC [Nitrosomonas aestuarii]
MDKSRKAYHQTVAENLIAQLKQGTAPWQKPWQPGDPLLSFPNNPTTKKRYRGINALYLMSQGYQDPRWLTYKQASNMGAQVRKGEKSTLIQYWKFTDERIKKDEHGKPVLNNDGKPVKEQFKLERPRVFYATVFNAGQIDNLPDLIIDPPHWHPIERAEAILQASGAVIQHGEHDQAFYRSKTDSIHLPHQHQFETPDRYYATALHELGHWTGHASRLNRDLVHPFGSEGYAREELRAEIASMLLGAELGIGHDPGQHVAYVGAWIKALEEDPLEIFRAAADAEKIQEYVLGFVQQQDIVEQEAIRMDAIKQDIARYTANLAPDLATVAQQNIQQLQKLTESLTAKDQDAIYLVADALRFYRNASIGNFEFEHIAADKLGFTIPAGWNGRIEIQGSAVEMNDKGSGHVVAAEKPGVEPEFWNISVQLLDRTWAWVEDFEVALHAQDAAEKLTLIDTVAERDEHEKAAKLARIDAVRSGHNPNTENRQPQNTQPNIRTPKKQDPLADNTRQYLAVPYAEKDQAKAAGARWDKVAKAWYVGENADIRALQRWFPENITRQQQPALSPQVEFAELLRANGCVVDGNHPLMDGHKHRIKVAGDKGGQKSGFYVAHLDNHPAGYFINNRTKSEIRWKAKGYTLTDAQKAAFAAQVAIKQQERQAALHAQQIKVADAIGELLTIAPQADANHPYLQDKNARPGGLKVVPESVTGLPKDSIIKIAQDWQAVKTVREQHPDSLVFVVGDLLLPIYDVDGHIRSAQTIQPNGAKLFAAGSQKEGHFHVIDSNNQGLAALDDAKAIIIAEGYATADTVSSALNCPVVAAFDSGNLVPVAKLLHERYTDKAIVIAGDDDQHLESINEINAGKDKAIEAAGLVDGVAVFPVFAPGEQVSQKLSDFNDLASKSTLGIDAVKRQVGSVVEKAIVQAKVEKLQTRADSQQPGLAGRQQQRAVTR